jgi:tetratricopeptide (TPR) repeat protein
MRYTTLLWLSLMALPLAHANHPMTVDHRVFDADPATAKDPIAPRLSGLGDYSFKVTTSVPESQYFFDQGLRLAYGFNHSEALRAFKESARLDPANAMAYWGWAFVLGPNINMPMEAMVAEQAFAAVQDAARHSADATPLEKALIKALLTRYAPVAPEDRSKLDLAYAEAMRSVARAFPDSLDAATLFADALMNLSPWNYWLPDGSPGPNTTELLDTLASVIARNPKHPGALHYHIHAVEATHPTLAVSSADALRGLMPGAGHMEHMPSHIYMRVGRFAESFEVNRLASLADESYIAQCKQQGIYPLNYYPHNLHFMVWSAMLQGRSAEALKQARKVNSKVPVDKDGVAAGMFGTFLAQPLYVMVRFGMWDTILAEPEPARGNKLTNGIWHYARGTALVHTGQVKKATRELNALRRLRKSLTAAEVSGFASSSTLLQIAEQLLAGDLAVADGRPMQGVAEMERAVRLEESLLYSEPPDWYFPTRHALGWALLQADLPAEAAVIYWQDLQESPANGFALKGLAQSLSASGDADGAKTMETRYAQAWLEADKQLTSSRF